MKALIKQIYRFAFVGGTAFILDFGILWLLTEGVGINYLISNVLSFTISTIYNYVLSVNWVFQTNNKTNTKTNHQTNLFVFTALSITALAINQFILYTIVETLKTTPLVAKIVATLITMVFNFITRKLFLERNKTE